MESASMEVVGTDAWLVIRPKLGEIKPEWWPKRLDDALPQDRPVTWAELKVGVPELANAAFNDQARHFLNTVEAWADAGGLMFTVSSHTPAKATLEDQKAMHSSLLTIARDIQARM